MCPVFRATGEEAATPRAKVNLLRVLAEPIAATPDEVKAVAALCVNCKMCRDECDARVNVPKLMLEAKAGHQAELGLDRSDWFLSRAEGFAALGSNFAPIINGLLARRPVRWVLEKLFGLSRRRRLPAFALRPLRVAYFVDVFAAYNDPLVGEATVAVLRHNGVEVYVPPRQVGCGMAKLAVGDVDAAREAAVRNIRALTDLVQIGRAHV